MTDLIKSCGGRPATYESWTGDCEATRSGPIGLAEARGNSYVVSDNAPEVREKDQLTTEMKFLDGYITTVPQTQSWVVGFQELPALRLHNTKPEPLQYF